MNAVIVNNISKRYGPFSALKSISFEVKRGELFGLIGPDGAGKTTLFRLLTTLITPDEGIATVDGLDTVNNYRKIRKNIGYMPDRFSLYQDLTVEENLNFFATLFNTTIERNYDLIEPIYKQIKPFSNRRAGKLSGGMKQKLALSCALIHRPSVLFLDEPTTGVDAVSRSEFWDMLSNLKSQGITILVSTPYMDEATRCDRIALMNEGKILVIDSPEGIIRNFNKPLYELAGNNMFALLQETRKLEHVIKCYPFGSAHHTVTSVGFSIEKAIASLSENGLKDVTISPAKPTIEDVFIELIQQ